jgi:hypothetical protein
MFSILRLESDTAIRNWDREKAKLRSKVKIREDALIERLYIKESKMIKKLEYRKV